jgi:predicted  nucleic acid-binding Zn-ribbon protein
MSKALELTTLPGSPSNSVIEKFERDLRYAHDDNRELRDELKDLKKKIQGMEEKQSLSRSQVWELFKNAIIPTIIGVILFVYGFYNIQDDINAASEKAVGLKSQLENFEKQMDGGALTLKSQLEAFQNQMKSGASDLDRKMDAFTVALQSKVDSFSSTAAANTVRTLNDQVTNAMDSIKALNSQVNSAQQIVSTSFDTITKAAVTINTYEKNFAATDYAVKDLKLDIARLKAETDSLYALFHSSEYFQTTSKMNSTINSLAEASSTLKASVGILQSIVGSSFIPPVVDVLKDTLCTIQRPCVYTLTTTLKNPVYIVVEIFGGGGGGGSGSYSTSSAYVAASRGANGGKTCFSSIACALGGGGGGQDGTYCDGGLGGRYEISPGHESKVAYASKGTPGQSSFLSSVTATPPMGGAGGSSLLGGAGKGVNSGPGLNGAESSGSGGGGGQMRSNGDQFMAGGGGGSGGYVKLVIGKPLNTYTYSIALGGTGAAAVDSLSGKGGDGGSGTIIITQYYQ